METRTAGDGITLPHQVRPYTTSLGDTQCVLGAYVTMYIAKERNKSIAQVGILTNAQLVQYIHWIWFNNQ
jgi:hypothetical protein